MLSLSPETQFWIPLLGEVREPSRADDHEAQFATVSRNLRALAVQLLEQYRMPLAAFNGELERPATAFGYAPCAHFGGLLSPAVCEPGNSSNPGCGGEANSLGEQSRGGFWSGNRAPEDPMQSDQSPDVVANRGRRRIETFASARRSAL